MGKNREKGLIVGDKPIINTNNKIINLVILIVFSYTIFNF